MTDPRITTAMRVVETLALLPVAPTAIATADLVKALQVRGLIVPHARVERDLRVLSGSVAFPVMQHIKPGLKTTWSWSPSLPCPCCGSSRR